MMQRMRRGWAYAAAHAAHHRPHPLGRLPACPPHTRRAAWHAAHGRRSCSATLATHAARRSSSLLLTPGSRRSLVDQPRRAAPPGSASSEPREPKAPQAAERVEEGAPGSRQLRRNRCSRDVAPGRSLRRWPTAEVTACRRPSAAPRSPQPAAAALATSRLGMGARVGAKRLVQSPR